MGWIMRSRVRTRGLAAKPAANCCGCPAPKTEEINGRTSLIDLIRPLDGSFMMLSPVQVPGIQAQQGVLKAKFGMKNKT